MMTDPIADMLTRIRNAVRVERSTVEMPASKVKRGLAEVLKREGYIWDWAEVEAAAEQSVAAGAEVRTQRRARDSAPQARQQAGPPRVQPRRPAQAVLNGMGISRLEHQPRRDQRPRSAAAQARRRSAVRAVVSKSSPITNLPPDSRIHQTPDTTRHVPHRKNTRRSPAGVKVAVSDHTVAVEGPKGKLEQRFPPQVSVKFDEPARRSSSRDTAKPVEDKAMHGLVRALVRNMVVGVTQGYEKKLEIVGVGYLAAVQKNVLQLRVGFANELQVPIPANLR